MWSKEEIIDYLKDNLKESRYIHTMGVVQCAIKLAKLNNIDPKRAEIAALIHDAAKYMDIEKQKKIIKDYGYDIDEVMEESPQLLHGFTASILGKDMMGIEDEELLSSVRYHTTGKKIMTTLEKIIYIADYIEPNRNFPGVEDLRKITFDNLDEGVLQGLSNSIIYVVKNGNMIHPLSLEARNYLISQKNKSIL